MSPRLTGVLRQWMQHDSGYPANWMPDVMRMLPKQVINVVPAGAGVAEMKEEYGRSLQILLGGLRHGAVDRVRQCREPAAGARRGAPRRKPLCASRLEPAGGRLSGRRWLNRFCLRSAAALPDSVSPLRPGACCLRWHFGSSQLLPISALPSPVVLAFAFAVALVTGIVFGAAPAWFATRTRSSGSLARCRPEHGRSFRLRPQGAADRAGGFLGGAGRRRHHAGAKPQQAGAPEFRVSPSKDVWLCFVEHPPATYTPPKLGVAVSPDRRRDSTRLPGVTGSGLALYNPLTDNWGELIMVSGHPASQAERVRGRLLGPRER